KIRFPVAAGVLALLDHQLPAVVDPVTALYQLAVAVVADFRYLVAVPQVAGLFGFLVAAFAGAPPEEVVTVEPAFPSWCVDNPELITARLCPLT
ncbi:hypothetical protein J8657_20855, partial [Dickeya oryzae]|nr:hypothetical protein [Dickeya oryzae]